MPQEIVLKMADRMATVATPHGDDVLVIPYYEQKTFSTKRQWL